MLDGFCSKAISNEIVKSRMKEDLSVGYVYMVITVARAHRTIAALYIVFGDRWCVDGIFDSAAVAAGIVGDESLYFRHDGGLRTSSLLDK